MGHEKGRAEGGEEELTRRDW